MLSNLPKRLFDFLLSFILLIIFSWLIAFLMVVVKATSSGPIFYFSNRIGVNGKIFKMPKFRTMIIETPVLPSHLLFDSSKYLTPIGSILRSTSLDELPQLWSILVGEMSFVGPRPALFNQDDLVALRAKYGINNMVPGLTGWAQVNGRDELSIPDKVRYDLEYLQKKSFWFDMRILSMTFLKVARRDGVSH